MCSWLQACLSSAGIFTGFCVSGCAWTAERFSLSTPAVLVAPSVVGRALCALHPPHVPPAGSLLAAPPCPGCFQGRCMALPSLPSSLCRPLCSPTRVCRSGRVPELDASPGWSTQTRSQLRCLLGRIDSCSCPNFLITKFSLQVVFGELSLVFSLPEVRNPLSVAFLLSYGRENGILCLSKWDAKHHSV